MKRKCVIIPAFNEERSIAEVIKGIRESGHGDIIVVDDGSTDKTGARAREAGAFVIPHPFNMGYGVALQTGYKYALRRGYDLLVQMDGDGQHDPDSIGDLFESVESGRCDMALGSRFLSPQAYEVGILKSFGIGLFRGMIRLMTGETITDPTSGYQCLKRTVFETLSRDIFPTDYPDANIIIMLHRMGFQIKEIPVAMRPNPAGRSMHQGVFRIVYYFFKMFLSFLIALIRAKGG
ncbi:MAG: glycosyltransferase family 2 protein [Deltaproteobacteria bacterium]|nr:glycosyltransferase family 2 protein [Deltaproteobacteria bacterium]